VLVKLAMKTWKMRKQGKACWQIHIFFFKNMSYLISARDSRRKKKRCWLPPKGLNLSSLWFPFSDLSIIII